MPGIDSAYLCPAPFEEEAGNREIATPESLLAWAKDIVSDGRSYLGIADHITIFPGLAILITVLAFNLLGDGLRDALDQKLR